MATDLTPRELDVMAILWDLGEASVGEVRERLADTLAYTSVLSVLQLLEHKGHVRHRREGRSYRYEAVTPRAVGGGSALRRVVRRVYRNSPARLVAELLQDEDLTRAELDELRALVERRLADREGP